MAIRRPHHIPRRARKAVCLCKAQAKSLHLKDYFLFYRSPTARLPPKARHFLFSPAPTPAAAQTPPQPIFQIPPVAFCNSTSPTKTAELVEILKTPWGSFLLTCDLELELALDI